MKVLIVDDDPIIQITLEANLLKWGYQPIIAKTAEIAWEILQKHDSPSLAIIDWQLPKINGIELCKLIKDQENVFCYLIMLSGRIGRDDVVTGLECGADDYLIKPFDATELKARLLVGKRILKKFKQLSEKPRSIDVVHEPSINHLLEDNFFSPQILIAEDDPVSRAVLVENLTRWGFKVIVTENGQQAIEEFRQHQGLILGIIDWMMPYFSGVEVCREIKAKTEEGSCYLILLTAKTQREDIVEGLESGADDYLSKPFHATELRARINVGIRMLAVNRHLKAIIANNSEGIVTIGVDGVIESFNPAAEKMFDRKTHEALGKSIYSLISTHDDREQLKQLILAPKIISQQIVELTGVKKDGCYFPIEFDIAQMNYDGNKHFVSIIRDISERKKYEEGLIAINNQLYKLANIDGLTEIANRRCFDDFLAKEWRRLCRSELPLSLLLLDIDYFKPYNDFYGHQGGDDCLIKIAKAIQKTVCRPADLAARYGGEEFVVVLPETDQAGAINIAEAIRSAIEGLAIAHQTSKISDHVTVSIGIACLIPKMSLNPEALIKQADDALYRAKHQGRNQYCVA